MNQEGLSLVPLVPGGVRRRGDRRNGPALCIGSHAAIHFAATKRSFPKGVILRSTITAQRAIL